MSFPQQSANWPEFALRPQGRLIFADQDFAAGYTGSKYGVFLAGTGTLSRDTGHTGMSGKSTGSAKLVTGAVSTNQTEIKISVFKYGAQKIAFEMKAAWTAVFGSSVLDFGIENRDNTPNAIQARIRFLKSANEWKYEDSSGTYQSFATPAVVEPPQADASQSSGDRFLWARLVIDVSIDPATNLPRNKYVSFEYLGKIGPVFIDMSILVNPNLFNGGNLGAGNCFLFFVLLQTGGAGAETIYTSDWAVSEVG